MNQDILISIIMPVYNAENTLKQSIDSVLSQDYQNWELILVDDGSTDMSGKICDESSLMDKRIKTTHTKNSGVSAARNLGIKLAQGELIGFIDSDDLFDRSALRIMVESMADTDLLIFGYTFIPSKIKRAYQSTRDYNSVSELAEDFELLIKDNLLNSVWNKCFRKRIISKYDCTFLENLTMGEDLLFALSYITHCNKIKILGDSLYYYNIEPECSLSKRLYLDSFEIQKQLKDATDTIFEQEANVVTKTSEIFVTRIVEDMTRIITSEKINHGTKMEIIRKWTVDDYLQEALYQSENKTKHDGITLFLLKHRMPKCFYAYVSVRFKLSEIKRGIKRSLHNG